MSENQQPKELGFADLFKILLKKCYVIIIAAIIAAVVGGLMSWSENKDVRYYGASAKFKISVSSSESGAEPTEISGLNYIYKETHLAMIVDELSSDLFVRDYIMAEIENMPVSDPEDPDYNENLFHSWLNYLKGCISYSYNYNKNPNAIVASVSVYKNQALAEIILDQIKVAIPEYIKENMIKPEDVDITDVDGKIIGRREYKTDCTEMTISYVRLQNAGQAESETKKSAAIFGFFAAIVAAVAVVAFETAGIQLFKKKAKKETDEE